MSRERSFTTKNTKYLTFQMILIIIISWDGDKGISTGIYFIGVKGNEKSEKVVLVK